MTGPSLMALLFAITAALSYFNSRFLRLPPTLGVLLGGLFLALVIGISEHFGASFWSLNDELAALPLDQVVMSWLLGFLLFASAIQTDVRGLLRERWVVLALAVVTTLLTMLVLGTGLYYMMQAAGYPLTWVQAMLFGAIVAPTDPVAVMPLLKSAGVPDRLQALIGGESLFNDGVGVASFTVLSAAAYSEATFSAAKLGGLLFKEMAGGLLLGGLLGLIVSRLMRQTYEDSAALLTLALVTGGYVLGESIGVSAPVTVATAGVVMSIYTLAVKYRYREAKVKVPEEREEAHNNLNGFWEVTDQVLNAVLFTLMALDVLVVNLRPELLPWGIVAALLTIVARGIGVWVPLSLYQRKAKEGKTDRLGRRLEPFPPYSRRLMTWAGLRGGVALALAYSLPQGDLRDMLMTLTYVVVLFSLLVQGLTVPLLGRKAAAAAEEQEQAEALAKA